MQTDFSPDLLATESGKRAEQILRSCVHCGFCNATCPTYQIMGDELDGPRGRIYLIKEVLEAQESNPRAQQHLDRCLTCRACETTCPSGVAYGELLEIGREYIEDHGARTPIERVQRRLLQWMIPSSNRFRRLAKLGSWFRWALPKNFRQNLPELQPPLSTDPIEQPPQQMTEGQVLLLDGCVQQAATPATNQHLHGLLRRHRIRTLRLDNESCCGGATLHLGNRAGALTHIEALLDQVKPLLEEVDAVISTASGCGVTLKDAARLVPLDSPYAALAQAFVAKVCDASEYVTQMSGLRAASEHKRVAWHAPCTFQHGQGLGADVETLLRRLGYELVSVAEPHLCCGSAGTYAVTQPEMAETLRVRKLKNLQAQLPDVIATANVGCQLHLNAASEVPVQHWLELIE